MKYKDININKDNYSKFPYLSDYRNGALEALTDEELKAQVFHLKKIYKGARGVMYLLLKMSLRSIFFEFERRKIYGFKS